MSVNSYSLDFFFDIFNQNSIFTFHSDVINNITALNNKVVPIVHDKHDRKGHYEKKKDVSRKNKKVPDNWKEQPEFVCTVIEKKEEGIDKWISEIRTCLNKMSSKNYQTQKDSIIDYLNKCIETSISEEDEKNNIKTIASYIFTTASNNKFFSEIYAKLYSELITYNNVFKDILINYVHNFSTSVEQIQYASPSDNYENYCSYVRQIESRKSSAHFICNIMKLDIIPILKVLKILQCYQETILKYIDLDDKNNEIEELAEIIYIILKECSHCFDKCKGEWIWKFVIISNIDTMSKFTKKDKNSLSSRSIFKFKDMKDIISKTN